MPRLQNQAKTKPEANSKQAASAVAAVAVAAAMGPSSLKAPCCSRDNEKEVSKFKGVNGWSVRAILICNQWPRPISHQTL